MSKEVILKVDSGQYSGWKNIQIDKSLDNIAGSFALVAAGPIPGRAKEWNISMGDECTVEINDQILISGYIESVPINYDANTHTIQMIGRDVTGDLVDCSYVGSIADSVPTEWVGQTVGTVLTNLCAPFDIDVVIHSSVSTQTAKIINVKEVEEGMTVFEMISTICKQYAILPVCYGDKKLTLTQAGTTRTTDALEFGVNIKAGAIVQSNMERFSKYIVKGYAKGKDTISVDEISNKVVGEYNDDVLDNRYRPLVILSENDTTAGQCKKEAEWEGVSRAGKSRSIDYTVQGWTQSDGKVWPLNSLVKVYDSFLEIDGVEFLIAGLTFRIDNEGGTVTTMHLVLPSAYELKEEEPVVRDKDMIATVFDWKTIRGIKEVITR